MEADVAGTIAEAMDFLALSLANQRPYKLLLLDIMLPDGTGYDLLHRLHHDAHVSEYRYTPPRIVMVTGMDDLKHIAGVFAEECNAYLTKPVQEKLLEELLKTYHFI